MSGVLFSWLASGKNQSFVVIHNGSRQKDEWSEMQNQVDGDGCIWYDGAMVRWIRGNGCMSVANDDDR